MYGLNGNWSALEWADEMGFAKVSKADQEKLIQSGHYTTEGHRILHPGETAPTTKAGTTTHQTIDIVV